MGISVFPAVFLKTFDMDFFFFLVFIEFVTILLLFSVLFFWPRGHVGILAPQSGIEPAPPAL